MNQQEFLGQEYEGPHHFTIKAPVSGNLAEMVQEMAKPEWYEVGQWLFAEESTNWD